MEATGIALTAPNGTEVGVAETEFGYFVRLDTPAKDGDEAVLTDFCITHDTLATLLVLMMRLPGGLRVPGMGVIHHDAPAQQEG